MRKFTDTDRLDWLVEHQGMVDVVGNEYRVEYGFNSLTTAYPSAREAIDAAMSESWATR